MNSNNLTALLAALAIVPLYFKEPSQPAPEKWEYRSLSWSRGLNGATVRDSVSRILGGVRTVPDVENEIPEGMDAHLFEVQIHVPELWELVSSSEGWMSEVRDKPLGQKFAMSGSRYRTGVTSLNANWNYRIWATMIFDDWFELLKEGGWQVFQVDEDGSDRSETRSKKYHLRRRVE